MIREADNRDMTEICAAQEARIEALQHRIVDAELERDLARNRLKFAVDKEKAIADRLTSERDWEKARADRYEADLELMEAELAEEHARRIMG